MTRRRTRIIGLFAALAIVAAGATTLVVVEAKGSSEKGDPPAGGGVDPERGKALMATYGCPTCHEIPGVRGANATVGPPLDRMGRRVYVGGRSNTFANIVDFLKHPDRPERRSPMPDVGLGERDRDARDIAAYLLTLR